MANCKKNSRFSSLKPKMEYISTSYHGTKYSIELPRTEKLNLVNQSITTYSWCVSIHDLGLFCVGVYIQIDPLKITIEAFCIIDSISKNVYTLLSHSLKGGFKF